MEKEISQAVIRRMPRYYRYLGELLEEGVERISSNDLSHRMMVTASQIPLIIIGAGNLGQAITNYVKFERFGFIITALFDVKPSLKGQTVRDIPIYMMDELDDYCKKNKVDIAALTLPKEKAEDTAQHLVNLGIRAIWNFAHVDLDLSDKSVVVENVHLSDSLMQLSYNIVKNSK